MGKKADYLPFKKKKSKLFFVFAKIQE